MTTVLFGEAETSIPDAVVIRGDLWLPAADLARVTGWELKPEGLCRDDTCVPVPPDRAGEIVRNDRVNLSAFARLLSLPAVCSTTGDAWAFSAEPALQEPGSESDRAPDFALPDLDGRVHRLSDYRGTKIFLVSWASW